LPRRIVNNQGFERSTHDEPKRCDPSGPLWFYPRYLRMTLTGFSGSEQPAGIDDPGADRS